MRRRLLPQIVASFLVALAPLPPALLAASPAVAGSQASVDAGRISDLALKMQIGPLLAVVREEGLAYGADLDLHLLGGSGGVPWRAEVARIYDPVPAQRMVEASLQDALAADPETLAAAEAFYASPLGGKVAGLEVDARRAFLDPAAKDAAMVAWQDMVDRRDPRAAMIQRLVATTGLIDQNVEGTLNANLALFRGLVEGSNGKSRLTEADLPGQVAAQEEAARAAAEGWLYPYMALAYAPLSEAEFADYAAYLTSPAGMKLSAAAFDAFDGFYVKIAHELGLAAAARIAGHDI